MKGYTVTSFIDLNDRTQTRPKSGSWSFDDTSIFNEMKDCQSVCESFILPSKGKKIKNLGELCKLTAHNYQVLKSVVLENKQLMQIIGDGYTMLKNDNGSDISICSSSLFKLDETTDLMTVAIACSLGGKISNYYFDQNKQLHIALETGSGINLSKIEDAKLNLNYDEQKNSLDPLSVLIAYADNRKELLSGVYNRNRICLIRGEKRAFFDKDAPEELKKRILEEMNR